MASKKNNKSSSSSSGGGGGATTPRTAPNSPFFHPSTPRVVVVQQTTPRGTRRTVPLKSEVTEHKSSILGCTANMMNAIVGAGIVGIPYAIQQAGFCAGLVLIVVVAILTETSLRWLINTAKHVHVGSYETLAEAAFGKAGFRFVALNMFVMAYGAMLTYLMIVKDTYATVLLGKGTNESILIQKRAVLLVVSLAVMVPLSSQRDMADLAKTSRLNVVIDTLLVLLVAFNAPIHESLAEIGGPTALLRDVIHYDTIFVGLGVLSFAFVCQHSAFIIAGSLERPTVKRWSHVTQLSLTLCAILALTCGTLGYVGYRDETDGNILNNFGEGWTATLARALMGTAMLFVYPLESFVARHVCIAVLFSGRRAHDGDSDASILNRRDRRIGLTVLLYLLAVLPAAFVRDMGSVLAITGAVGGSCLSYIGPGLVFLGVHGGRFLDLISQSWMGCMLPREQHRLHPNLVATDSTDVPDNLVETTPLVAGGNGTANSNHGATAVVDGNPPDVNEGDNDNDDDVPRDPFYFLKAVVWYMCGFPLWCAIAGAGRRGLTRHVHDMTLKSPHPIRIGNVEYSRVLLSEIEHGTNVSMWPPQHHSYSSFPSHLSEPSLSPNGSTHGPPTILAPSALRAPINNNGGGPQSVNARIGQDLLRKQQQQQQKKPTQLDAVEADPLEALPTAQDFVLAIFYILFGVLAMVAGIFSLFAKDAAR